MKNNQVLVRLLLLLVLLAGRLGAHVHATVCDAPATAQITGIVTDAKTGAPVPHATILYKGRGVGVVSDREGRYSVARHQGWALTFSAVGYAARTFVISDQTPSQIDVRLESTTNALKEVTVSASRGRYSRKNNPAVDLMRRVIDAKKRNRLDNRDYYQYNKYQKLTLAINGITPDQLEDPKLKKKKWLVDQVEVCPYNNKLILPVSVDETVSQKIFRKEPHSEKTIVKGMNSIGVNGLLQTGDILTAFMKELFTDVDIYDDQIRMLQYPFTSPIGKDAIAFYRFYIEDTLLVDRDRCIRLTFLPNNQQDFGFRGQLFVVDDSSYQVKRCELTIPKKSDVNFVENMQIVQEYTQLLDSTWVLSTDDMFTELVPATFLHKFAVIRKTRLTDYAFDELPKQLFKGKRKEVHDVNAMMRGEGFWNQYRQVELTKSENNTAAFLEGLQNIKGFKYLLWVAKAFIENFVELSIDKDHPSKVDIGPVNTVISSNFIDGMRNRLSAQTTANLDSNFFAKGYYAHGWKSRKDYYSAELTWSFNKKEYLPAEFPKRTFSLLSTYDVMSPSDKFMHTDKDNVFTSFKWTDVDRMMFYNRQAVTFEREEDWGFRTTVAFKTEENDAVGKLFFIPMSETADRSRWTNWSTEADGSLPPADGAVRSRKIRTTELRAELRFAPGETFINTKQRRMPVNFDAPVLTIGHTLGIKGLLGGDYSYNYTEASLYKRFWLNSWGKLDVMVKGGIQWEKVPFPLLIMPAADLSYILQDNTFSLINDMEFLNDRFISADLSWDLNGKLFNRIPLLKKLKWRETIAIRGLWGDLSDKNNPTLWRNHGSPMLMYFPEGSYVMDSAKPYWEMSLGVHNILKIFHVEYVRRLNYTHLPAARKHGVRFMVEFTF